MGRVRVVTSIALITVFLALIGCGGSGSAPLRAGGPEQAAPQSVPSLSVDLQQALRQLDALPTPEGADAATFTSLKAGLRRMLVERGTGKFTSAAPGSGRSKVNDLTVQPYGGGVLLHWSYRNEGDFNQDGIVNIADLALMGINYGKDSAAPDWATARAADGNENGQVDLPDLVSLGANFLNRVTGYYLQRSDTLDSGGTWTQVADIPFASSSVPAGQLRQFDFLVHSVINGYYRVVPYDSTSAGVLGNPVYWPPGPGDWWMFGHDLQHTRRSPFTGPTAATLVWAYTTGWYVDSSPAIGVDGTVYVGSWDSKLYAINLDGSLKWAHTMGSPVTSSPAIGEDGTVYVGSDDNNLYAVNPDGSLKWACTTGGGIWYSSPAIGEDGTVYVGSDDYNLYAIKPDGSLKWVYTTAGLVESSPAIGTDGTVYVGSDDYNIYAINPDGSLKWAYTTGSYVSSSPAIGADGTVYVGSYDDKLYAINPDGSLKWAYTTDGQIDSSPAIGTDGTVYVGSGYYHGGSGNKKLYAINPDGSLKWSYSTGGAVYSSPAIGADGTVYVGSDDDNLYAVNPDGSLMWAYTMGYSVQSSPAIGADGTVYVGSDDGKLYAIGPGGG